MNDRDLTSEKNELLWGWMRELTKEVWSFESWETKKNIIVEEGKLQYTHPEGETILITLRWERKGAA